MNDQPRRLYRSHTNRVFAGICGGLGEYFGIDPTLVRILWAVLVFAGGSGLFLYLIGIFVIPKKPIMPGAAEEPAVPTPSGSVGSAGRLFGIVFVAVGVLLLLDNLDVIAFDYWWHRGHEFIIPVALIAAGAYLISRRARTGGTASGTSGQPPVTDTPGASAEAASGSVPGGIPQYRQFFRSRRDRKIAGVCGGLAAYLEIDPTIVRILYAGFTLVSFGAGVIVYLLVALIVPEEPYQPMQGV